MVINSTGNLLNIGRKLPKEAVKRVLQEQVRRIQERLDVGVDIHGRPFAPYKYPKRARQSRPLLHASRLFEPVEVDVRDTGNGAVGTISIYGRAARIARWQNRLRQFYGYNDADREAILQDVRDEVRRISRGNPLSSSSRD